MTTKEEAALKKAVEGLETKMDSLATRVADLLKIGPPDAQQDRRVRFQENGSWARHYSTVRMTVATFLVPVSLGILAFRWKTSEHPPLVFVALSGVMWSIALVLFLSFTRLTYGAMERARQKRGLMSGGVPEAANGQTSSTAATTSEAIHPCSDVASWIFSLLSIAFGLLLLDVGDIGPSTPMGKAFHGSLAQILFCHVPAAVIVLGAAAILITLFQEQPE